MRTSKPKTPTGVRPSSQRGAFALRLCAALLGLTLAACFGADPGDRSHDCAVCPEMVVVPAGTVAMSPRHRVRFEKPFAIGVYEVTVDEWNACVEDFGCAPPGDPDGAAGRRTQSHQTHEDGSLPVTGVSWNDAQEYVRWLSEKSGELYRLPSESEWVYAARAGTTTNYWWGDEIGVNQANCDGCGSEWDDESPAPVGSFPANPFGLHDVHGNVWEMTQDCFNDTYDGAPRDGSAWESSNDTSIPPAYLERYDCVHRKRGPNIRVVRGGSWKNTPRSFAQSRFGFPTGGDDSRQNYVGFRVAQTLTP